jgi:hypothetical protein
MENRQKVDDALSFLTIKKLVTPVTKTKAYKFGLVDGIGKIIKEPETSEEKSALTLFDKFIFKMRRLLGGKIGQLNNFLYVQTLDNDFYNQLIVRGSIDQRASIKRIKKDFDKVLEKYNIDEYELMKILISESITEEN